MVSFTAHCEHREWIIGLREIAPPSKQQRRSLSDELALELSGMNNADSSVSCATAESIDSVAFTDFEIYDEEPVYRSLSGSSSFAVEVVDDPRVYRSLGDAASEEEWLTNLPPLVCRQTEFLDLSL